MNVPRRRLLIAFAAPLRRGARAARDGGGARRLREGADRAHAGERARAARVGDRRRSRPPVLHRRGRRRAAADGSPQLRAAGARLGIRAPGRAGLPARTARCWSATATRRRRRAATRPQAGLLRVDPSTGEQQPYASGLTMSNGVARGPDGAVYASNDFGPGVDRVLDGAVTLTWARSPRRTGSSSTPAASGSTSPRPSSRRRSRGSRSPIPRTWRPGTRRPRPDSSVALDGLTRDAHDRLYVAAQPRRPGLARPGRRPRDASLTHLPPLGPERGRLRERRGQAPARLRPPQPLRRHLPGRPDPAEERPRPKPVAPTPHPSRHTET